MRRMSAALVALSAAIALVALSAPAWATTARSSSNSQARPLAVSPTDVQQGGTVRVSGGGCQRTALRFRVDGGELHRVNTGRGDWSYKVQLPTTIDAGDHSMTAECKGGSYQPAHFRVLRRGSFSVWPHMVIAGEKIFAHGRGCWPNSRVLITLGHGIAKVTFADEDGRFATRVRTSKRSGWGHQVVSAFCGKRYLGSDHIRVKPPYRHHRDHVYWDRSVAKPGDRMRVRGDDCRGGKPGVWMDDTRVNLTSSRTGNGFNGEVTVPRGTSPGIHQFRAGCDNGSQGSMELTVLDQDEASPNGAGQPFGPQPTSDLAMWVGLFAGLALLVASAFVTTRRRRNQG